MTAYQVDFGTGLVEIMGIIDLPFALMIQEKAVSQNSERLCQSLLRFRIQKVLFVFFDFHAAYLVNGCFIGLPLAT